MWARRLVAIAVLLALLPVSSSVAPSTVLASSDSAQPMEYVPRPAKQYALTPADVGHGFRELAHDESEDGAAFACRMIPPDARIIGENLIFSPSDVAAIDNLVFIEGYGSDAEVMLKFNTTLDELRGKYGANVQPAAGWGSDQVYSYAWAKQPVMYRGILLRHRNAVVVLEMFGLEQHATWDRLSSLTRIVESRIHAAIQ